MVANIKVVHKKPLFFWLLKLFFPATQWDKAVDVTVVSFGTQIYCSVIPAYQIIKHEEVHLQQQKHSKLCAVWWWVRYCLSKKFRLNQEIPAHRAEYRSIHGSLNTQHSGLIVIAHRLASPLYGNMVDFQEAMRLIKQ